MIPPRRRALGYTRHMADSGRDGLLGRLRSMLGRRPGGEEVAARARWPHLQPGWLDPSQPVQAWRTTVDLADAAPVLRAISAASDGRVGAAEVAEIQDCLARTADGAARAFRFGERLAFLQVWIGAVPKEGSLQLTVLGDLRLVERVGAALSIAGFPAGPERDAWERHRRFLLAVLRWQWTEAPGAASLRAAGAGVDVEDTLARLERISGDPSAQLLESLRGLRKRVGAILDELAGLDPAGVAAADAWLAARGAPTVSELRRDHGAA